MDERKTYSRQHDPSQESVILENNHRELLKNFENGYPSAFQEILANNIEHLQHSIETIANQEGYPDGLTKEVIKALFGGIQAKIADHKFVRWVAKTGAKAAVENFRSQSTPDQLRVTL